MVYHKLLATRNVFFGCVFSSEVPEMLPGKLELLPSSRQFYINLLKPSTIYGFGFGLFSWFSGQGLFIAQTILEIPVVFPLQPSECWNCRQCRLLPSVSSICVKTAEFMQIPIPGVGRTTFKMTEKKKV